MKIAISTKYKGIQYYERGAPVSLVPRRATRLAAGYDIRAAHDGIVWVKSKAIIGSGVHVQVPEGHVADVRSRSGLAANDSIFVLNSPGTIDSDYRDELKVILFNLGEMPFHFYAGQRIAQLVLLELADDEVQEVDTLDAVVGDRIGGLGSTG